MKPAACSICGRANPELFLEQVSDYITSDSFQIWRCHGCGVGFTLPVPEQADRYYPPRYRQYNRFITWAVRALYKIRAGRWARGADSSRRALEIGCGDGFMLETLQRAGWWVVGTERNISAAGYARNVRGLPVFVGGLDALGPQAGFDLIILFHVLEHMSDPLGILKQSAALLTPTGRVLVAVPNLDSWQAKYAGERWFHLDVPRHLFHFSTRSLQNVFELAGLEVIDKGHVSFEHDPYGWAESMLNRSTSGRANVLTRRFMKLDKATPRDQSLLPVGLALLGPGVLLSLLSWMAGRGATVTMTGQKAGARGQGSGVRV